MIRLELTEQQASDLLNMLNETPHVLFGYSVEAAELERLLREAIARSGQPEDLPKPG